MDFNDFPEHEMFEAISGESLIEEYQTEDDGGVIDGFEIDGQTNSGPFDDNFKLYIKNPTQIDEATLNELGKLIDGKYSDDFRDLKRIVSKPDTVEQIKNADMVEYITYDGIPVGVLTVTDPTKENYMNIVPSETYALHSAYNLGNRLEIEYFVVSSEMNEYPVAQELVNHLIEQKIATFMVCPTDDFTTNELMRKVHYKYVKTFRIDAVNYDINLYVNHE
jgi:hypothetical protein